jgi:hypothetical protein
LFEAHPVEDTLDYHDFFPALLAGILAAKAGFAGPPIHLIVPFTLRAGAAERRVAQPIRTLFSTMIRGATADSSVAAGFPT